MMVRSLGVLTAGCGEIREVSRCPGAFSALARGLLLLVILTVYIGAMPFLILFSPQLLYGMYLAIISGAATILFFDYSEVRGLRWVAPYLAWVCFYCYWGALVAPPEMPLGEVAKTCLKSLLVICGLALALHGRDAVARFANGVQIAAMVNMGIAVWETGRPDIVLKLARAHDPTATAFNVERPAGIWSNPDEASFAYLFAILVSFWGRGPLVWLGRIACVVGIFLTASRTGAYVLGLFTLVYVLGQAKAFRLRPGTVASILFGVLALGGALTVAAKLAPHGSFDLSENRQVRRILDFSENDVRSNGQLGRTDIARLAADEVFGGPWYGHGIYTFQIENQRYAALKIGAHNLYITVWGESGFPGGVSYFLLLALGFSRVFKRSLSPHDRLLLMLLWGGYLVIGLTWHNQVTSFAGMLYSGCLWHLPGVLAANEAENSDKPMEKSAYDEVPESLGAG